MPLTVNCAQPREVGPVRFVDRFKAAAQKKTAAVRGWCDRRGQGCLRSVVDKFRGSKRRQSETRSDPSKTAERKPEHREVFLDLPYEAGSVSSFSTVLDTYHRASSSTISLPSTFSMGSMNVPEPRAPQPSSPRASLHFAIDTPADFERFRSDLRHRVELESVPPAMPTGKPEPKTKCFNVDSTPIPVGEESPQLKFKAYPGKPDTENQGPVTFQAYSAGSKLRHRNVGYIPPTLQSGFVNGVPPALRAAHGGNNNNNNNNSTRHRGKPKATATGDASQNYSWPLVDFHKEIFLNAEPSQTNHSSRYQEPRIPSMEFSGRGLGDEVQAVLDNLRRPVVERAAAHVEDRAWMSPGSPLHSTAYEREACIPVVTAKAGEVGGHHPRVLTVGTPQKPERSMGSVRPPSSNERTVRFSEYNWPRFSDDQYTDPAEEYSRQYRRRRREARREMASRRGV
ncbi:hypothetical protein CLAIMM_15182 [Cladophialophora immunda]|nr:hypothetical protein CLAIMM_15182 [Cladophialophora immunda]